MQDVPEISQKSVFILRFRTLLIRRKPIQRTRRCAELEQVQLRIETAEATPVADRLRALRGRGFNEKEGKFEKRSEGDRANGSNVTKSRAQILMNQKTSPKSVDAVWAHPRMCPDMLYEKSSRAVI